MFARMKNDTSDPVSRAPERTASRAEPLRPIPRRHPANMKAVAVIRPMASAAAIFEKRCCHWQNPMSGSPARETTNQGTRQKKAQRSSPSTNHEARAAPSRANAHRIPEALIASDSTTRGALPRESDSTIVLVRPNSAKAPAMPSTASAATNVPRSTGERKRAATASWAASANSATSRPETCMTDRGASRTPSWGSRAVMIAAQRRGGDCVAHFVPARRRGRAVSWHRGEGDEPASAHATPRGGSLCCGTR